MTVSSTPAEWVVVEVVATRRWAQMALYAFAGLLAAVSHHRPLIGGLVVMSVLALLGASLTWRQPIEALAVLAVGVTYQQLVEAWLFRRGIPLEVLEVAGYWKEFVFAVVVARAIRDGAHSFDRIDRLAVALIALFGLYLVGPVGPGLDVRFVAARNSAAALVVLLVARSCLEAADPTRRDRCERIIMVSATITGALGLWNYLAPDAWARWVNGTGLVDYRTRVLGLADVPVVLETQFGSSFVTRAGSVYLGPNTLAYPMLIAIAIAGGRFLQGRRTRLDSIVLAVCGAALTVTFTRSAIALAPVVGILLAARSGRLARGAGTLVVVGVCAMLAAATVGDLQAQVTSGVDSDDPRTSAHIDALVETSGRVLSNPLGTGLGTSSGTAIRFDVSGRLENSENFYLLVGVEAGLVALILYVWFMLSVFRRLWTPRAGPPPLGLVGAWAAVGLGALVLDTLANVAATWPLFLLVGLALARGDRAPSDATSTADQSSTLPGAARAGPET